MTGKWVKKIGLKIKLKERKSQRMTVVGYKENLGVSAQEGETLGQMSTVRIRGLLTEPETAGAATGNFALFSLYEF